MEEWTGEPDVDEARRRIEAVFKYIRGEIAEAEDAEEVRVALRRAVADVRVGEVRDSDGLWLYVHIWLRTDDFPALLLEAEPDKPPPLAELVPALLGGEP